MSTQGGIVIGNTHAEGGEKFIVQNTGKLVELEKREFVLCSDAWNSHDVIELSGTPLEILIQIAELYACKTGKVEKIEGGEFVICRAVFEDQTNLHLKGTVRHIINQLQARKGCKVDIGNGYMKDGGGINILLAPNGKPSNLNKTQWNLVRTPEFKHWFGDWENSPQTASKVIDENGEPMVVYHGTTKDFNTFDLKKAKKNYANNYLGFWFETNKNTAELYAEKKGTVKKVFVKITNPKWFNPISDWQNHTNYFSIGQIKNLRNDLIKENKDGILYGYEPNEIKMVVAFYSQQIKLADGTNTTFDSSDLDIRYESGGGIELTENKFKIKQTETVEQWIERLNNDEEYREYSKQMELKRKSESDKKHFSFAEIKEIAKRIDGFVTIEDRNRFYNYSTIFFNKYTTADRAITELKKQGYIVSDRKQNPANIYFKFKIEVEKPITELLTDGGNIESQIAERLQSRQKSKEFKDTGIATYTRKYHAAYDIITSSDLADIEKDNVTAYKLIEKSKIWPPYNVNELREQFNSSGCAYLKVKCREFLSARPLDTKEARAVYVQNIEKLKAALQPLTTAMDVRDYLGNFANLDKFDLGDISYMKKSYWISSNYTGNLAKYNSKEVEEYFNDIFGKKFYNFCQVKSDSAKEIVAASFLYEKFTQEQRNAAIEMRYIKAQNYMQTYSALLEKIKEAPDDETALRALVTQSGISYYEYNYKKQFLIDYISKTVERFSIDTREKINAGLSKIFTVRDDDWSWAEHTEAKPKAKDEEGKPRQPQNIFEKYGIETPKVLKREPLDFIKRKGGLDVGDVSTKSVLENFGFKNIIYGNYVNDAESKEHTRHVLGSMLDLVELCNIDIKDINRLGGLDINIGATGCGPFSPAAACYFSSLKAINITKKRGDGSIGHEWAHYLDNVLAEGAEKKATNIQWATGSDKTNVPLKSDRITSLISEYKNWMMTGGRHRTVQVVFYPQKKFMYTIYGKTVEEAVAAIQKRHEVYRDYKNYFNADVFRYYGYIAYKLNGNNPITVEMVSNATDFWVNSSKYSPFDYYTDPQELFARAFQSWLEYKLEKKNMANNYLVSTTKGMGLFALIIPKNEWPYPFGEELLWLDDWFERLFSAIRVDYNIKPFNWNTTERVDEYTEYKKTENSKTDSAVSVSQQHDEVTVVGDETEEFEPGYGFRKGYIKDALGESRMIYHLITNPYSRGKGMAIGGIKSDVFIFSLKYFTPEKAGYGIADGLSNKLPNMVKSLPALSLEEAKKEAVEYFKTKEVPVKVQSIPMAAGGPILSPEEKLMNLFNGNITSLSLCELSCMGINPSRYGNINSFAVGNLLLYRNNFLSSRYYLKVL